MKRILIAYDATPGAEAALRDLAFAGLAERAEATVLSLADVWLPPDPEKSAPVYPERAAGSLAAARENALSALANAQAASAQGAEQLKALFPLWQIRPVARADSPAWGILAEARRWPADLVALGSHGRSPLQKFFLGSVSFKVAAEANCSVRVFKAAAQKTEATETPPRLVVAVDGSPDSRSAVEEVLERDWPNGTEIHLLSVLDPKSKTGSHLGRETGGAEDWLAGMLAEQAGRFQGRPFTVRTHLVESDVKSAVLENARSWAADCIFMGARGMDHRDRLYLGTSASAVVSRAHCTVEIVRARNDVRPAMPALEPSGEAAPKPG